LGQRTGRVSDFRANTATTSQTKQKRKAALLVQVAKPGAVVYIPQDTSLCLWNVEIQLLPSPIGGATQLSHQQAPAQIYQPGPALPEPAQTFSTY
jgi:hypothetical protein